MTTAQTTTEFTTTKGIAAGCQIGMTAYGPNAEWARTAGRKDIVTRWVTVETVERQGTTVMVTTTDGETVNCGGTASKVFVRTEAA